MIGQNQTNGVALGSGRFCLRDSGRISTPLPFPVGIGDGLRKLDVAEGMIDDRCPELFGRNTQRESPVPQSPEFRQVEHLLWPFTHSVAPILQLTAVESNVNSGLIFPTS